LRESLKGNVNEPLKSVRKGTDVKLYDGGRSVNPRRVRVFLAEKGISVPVERVDLAEMEHRADEFTAINPLQLVPALVLDDGVVITESIAICRYFEALQPEPVLFGRAPLQIAMIEMWQRRIELHLLLTIGQVFRHLHPGMAGHEVPQVPDWGEANKPRVLEFLGLLDREMAGRRFAAGDDYSVADITGLIAVDFLRAAKMSLPVEFIHLARWHQELSDRPSAKA
jgi:glutathione S-transferase